MIHNTGVQHNSNKNFGKTKNITKIKYTRIYLSIVYEIKKNDLVGEYTNELQTFKK